MERDAHTERAGLASVGVVERALGRQRRVERIGGPREGRLDHVFDGFEDNTPGRGDGLAHDSCRARDSRRHRTRMLLPQ